MASEPHENPPGPHRTARGGPEAGDTEVDEGTTHPFGWFSLLIVIALVVGTWFLVTKLSDDAKLQDCVQSGRRNCAPVDEPGSGR